VSEETHAIERVDDICKRLDVLYDCLRDLKRRHDRRKVFVEILVATMLLQINIAGDHYKESL
jgi:hypothetical protein